MKRRLIRSNGERGLPSMRISICLIATVLCAAGNAVAQDSRTAEIEQKKAVKAANVQPEKREKGDLILTKLERIFIPTPPAFRPTLGAFRAGAGFGAGLSYAAPAGRGLWTTSAAWSVKNFKQVHTVLDLPPVAGGRLTLSPFVKWDDAPDLPYFGLGAASLRTDETSYALRLVDAGLNVKARAARWFQYGGSVGYFGAHSGEGAGPERAIGTVFSNASAPGLGSAPTWLHSTGFLALDTRESPGYTQTGALYSVAFHRYSDRGDQFTFNRTVVDLRQFIPVMHSNWIVALQGRAEMTATPEGQTVPYYLLPTIGGRDDLPGFGQYRFADRNSLLLRSELRWPASPLVDMAFVFDQGKVAPRAGQLNFGGLRRSVGIGIRFHGPTFTALRMEIDHSVEGWRFNIAHGFTF